MDSLQDANRTLTRISLNTSPFVLIRSLLKSQLLYLQVFDFIERFKVEFLEYLYYYNNRRIKTKLKGMTPAQHRFHALQIA